MIRDFLASQSNRLIVEGVAVIALGALAIAFPTASFAIVAALFALWMTVSGVLQLVAGREVAQAHGRAWPYALAGVASFAAAAIALFAPQPTLLGLVVLAGISQAITGAVELVAAWHARRLPDGTIGLAISGVARVVLGITFVVSPNLGLTIGLAFVSASMILAGIAILASGIQVRRGVRDIDDVRADMTRAFERVEADATSQS
jgi:uncharacterized membrane protein HdeD (DUF308 family)